ncbi:hypothetical protein K466DRAFT_495238 [Polyporus arcularius HHB13444]|uniref:CxC5 like cysteine cluster associated with KDZ domain-containing protein n=1 Tax=Polyporus arcularius HHB13444 TaxID=1314778 RepID=A0A5C3P8F5_9APHY|nr:hypothetical protein K466DRAFT_495238 [Polyporus arcularius HHB13444]
MCTTFGQPWGPCFLSTQTSPQLRRRSITGCRQQRLNTSWVSEHTYLSCSGSPLITLLGAEVIAPAVRACLTPECPQQGKPLGGHKKQYLATLYTRQRGTLPVQVISLYCKGCHTTYRPDYFVQNASAPDAVRQYYPSMPKYLEASEYSFVESSLIELFRNQMAVSQWVAMNSLVWYFLLNFRSASGEVVARIYNMGLSDILEARPLSADTVWHAFYLHALLLDCRRRSERLRLPHAGVHAARLLDALEARNTRMAGVGQPHWAHACDECEKLYPPPDPAKPGATWERLSACVMDGVTVGHPRCNESLCTNRLRSPRDRFCAEHDKLNKVCSVTGCALNAEDNMRTCRTPEHREYEKTKREEGKAFFRLKKHRADGRRNGAAKRSSRAVPSKRNGKQSDPPAMVVKGSLGRRWTHNEQLMFWTCGVIISRATFYESESVHNALTFILATFPDHLPRALPSYLFFDNNCNLLKHILHNHEHRLDDVGLPVDVFHALRKHKESDGFCVMNCNPANFKELYSELLGWLFNSSAAEQGNVWFGKFMPVVREMSEIHYNFFLDEMILIHNEQRVALLEKRGLHPRLVPIEELALPRAPVHAL